jgi:cysteine desulfurase / selenocysteine lyase
MPGIDVGAARRDTPGCICPHPRVHLNNAGASFSPAIVVDTVAAHLRLEQTVGGYEAASAAADASARVYAAIAALINADPSEISCTESATRAWHLAFHSLAAARAAGGKLILTTATEYGSNQLAIVQAARRFGATVEYLAEDGDGAVDIAALRRALGARGPRVLCVSLAWIATNGGLVQPAAAVGAACREYSVPLILDACQAVGQLCVDVRALGCDALCATGRKFLRGPRGIGFLYVRRGGAFASVEPVFLDIWSAALAAGGADYAVADGGRRFEAWERPVALWLGLGAAARYALDIGMPAIEARVLALGDRLRAEMAEVPGVVLLDRGRAGERCGIVSFNVRGVPAASVQRALAEAGVNVSVSGWGSTLRDMEARGIETLVRASVHYYNNEEDVRALVEQLRRIAS